MDLPALALWLVTTAIAVAALLVALGIVGAPRGSLPALGRGFQRDAAGVDRPAPAGSLRDGGAAGPRSAGAPREPALGRGLGLVRFDAFDDTAGGQSFALALLDDRADGVVLSSLHSRQATRIYVKRIVAGQSDLPLSGEEARALQEAWQGVRARPASEQQEA
jgi:hypothetical protein